MSDTKPMSDLEWVLHQDEGQFFERKGGWDTTSGPAKPRDPRSVAKDIAETLAAMANADGGSLVVGIEDNGDVTGLDYPESRLDLLRQAPHSLVRPPLRPRLTEATLQGKPVLLFEVDWSPDVHQLSDGRYVLRINDGNVPFGAEEIKAIKDGKRRRVTEMRPVMEASLEDLDLSLVAETARRAGLNKTPEQTLAYYRLVERSAGRLVLTLAALLLFGKDPARWHPRCGVDFTHYKGNDRKAGAALNIIKRVRVESPLVRLIEDTYHVVQSRMNERQPLVDLFFEEGTEYPTFAWQEAIVNAVAHRDYGYEGLGIEIEMYDNRLEVRSPGELVEPVTLERLRRRERVHASRNPRIMRVLTDFRYAREKGEGVPRIFEEMEREGLYPPDLRLDAGSIFQVTLKNTPTYSRETMHWLRQYEGLGLSGNQKRLLAYAKEHGSILTSRAYQNLTGVDLYTASQDIRDLIRKDIVRLPQKGGRTYRLADAPDQPQAVKPDEYRALEPLLQADGLIRNQDIRDALGLTLAQAGRVAARLVTSGWLIPEGERRARRYRSAR